ncbi:lytic murein transglycosylase [Lysobacter sp. K5869]|uniref:DUF2268 domain-containing putative Zn-dependent protease n=1 Tax=Lysobacter sp. K5869 TaxID=2820808 RepID=UPI001C063922|nr:DUF2268 domain-containing putative Zn-dependent protease [Lysobacter sp. K5869]QWP78369.1 lytic murein transglycosylase [Lysobacter sp. K5869]
MRNRPIATGSKTRARLTAALLSACLPFAAHAVEPEIRTDDVERFYALYNAADGHPSVAQLDEYLAQGSPSLKEFAQLRRVTGERIAAQIAADPAMYRNARQCLALLPKVKRRVATALRKLGELYPQSTFPPVAIVVGRGKPVGITNPSGVTVGLEALCAADFMNPDPEDRFVRVIAHEYAHIQQPFAALDLPEGDPRVNVLSMSLTEGGAEFVAELIAGGVANPGLAGRVRGQEQAVGEAFLREQDKTDFSQWMFNYKKGSDAPYDQGYWVGYRIARAYYRRADDKRAALAEILRMPDPKAFLTQSGWTPGQ